MKAIALISGGLDSLLALRLIEKQGIEVVALKFKIPFSKDKKIPLRLDKTEVKEVDIGNEFLELVKRPRYGFGSQINPCIDCKIFMLSQAKELMPKFRAQFVITGEVLGQRPMSQNKAALKLIEHKSGLSGLLLRPLSAKLLEETIPEKEEWVKRDLLLSFSGRSRRPQIELAKNFGIREYAQPAGGCLLTDPEFTKRLKDLLAHNNLDLDNIELLKIGRHFRIAEGAKLIIGRDERENMALGRLSRKGDYLFFPKDIAGPVVLGRGEFNKELVKLSLAITSRYCDKTKEESIEISYKEVGKDITHTLLVKRKEASEIEPYWI